MTDTDTQSGNCFSHLAASGWTNYADGTPIEPGWLRQDIPIGRTGWLILLHKVAYIQKQKKKLFWRMVLCAVSFAGLLVCVSWSYPVDPV
jgi:hypothetical protein